MTRDYVLDSTSGRAARRCSSVFGGKITTYRKLAEEAADLLAAARAHRANAAVDPRRRAARRRPRDACIGDRAPPAPRSTRPSSASSRRSARAPSSARSPALVAVAWRGAYGTRAAALLAAMPVGAEIAPGVLDGELAYLRATNGRAARDDVLWRRTKLGLHLDAAAQAAVAMWMAVQGEDERAFGTENAQLG